MIITVVILIGCFGIGSMILVKVLYDQQFVRVEVPEFSRYLRFSDLDGYEYQSVSFRSGANTLQGYLFGYPSEQGLVVIAHGMGGGAESDLAEILFFVDQGWSVFAYDCTGTYASDGDSMMGLAQSVIDLDAALKYIRTNSDLQHLPVMLYGHSWGGYAVATVLNFNHDAAGVVTIAGFNSPNTMLLEQAVQMLGPLAYIEYPFMWLYQTILFGKEAHLTAVDGINKAGVPVMVVHGTKDRTVSFDSASIISKREMITNPNVVYKVCDQEGKNGHNNLFMSDRAISYITQKNAQWQDLREQYGSDVPHDVKAAYHDSINCWQSSELDLEFMSEINDFLLAIIR